MTDKLRLEKMQAAGLGLWAPEAIAEDLRIFEEFKRTGEAVPLDEVKAWVDSWGTPNELPPPKARKIV